MSSLQDQVPRFDEAFDALERGDLDGFTAVTADQTHPECEFRSAIGSVVGGASYRGVEGIRSWFADLIATTSERHWRNRRYETHGDGLLVFLADLQFVGATSGAPVSAAVGSVFEYEDGRCIRINSFMSHEEAREFAEARVA